MLHYLQSTGTSVYSLSLYPFAPEIETGRKYYVRLIDDDLFMDTAIDLYDLTVLNIGQSLFQTAVLFPLYPNH